MAFLSTELWTAIRLSLSYTHRSRHLHILLPMVFRRFILLLLLALLPLRGFAMSEMQISMAAGQWAASAMQGANDGPHSAAMPCHSEGAPSTSQGEDLTPLPSQASSNHHNACALCDLCNSVAMVCALEPLAAAPASGSTSLSLVSTDTGHALVSRLERPPRRS